MKITDQIKETGRAVMVLVRWIILGVITGLIVGITGTAFHYCTEILAEARSENKWIIFLMPVCGIFIVWLYKKCDMSNDKGTNAVLLAVREDEVLPLKTAFLIFISTVVTHFAGGSSGREGAALQIGGSIAAAEGKLIHLDEKDKKIIIMSGMSACFSALFGTPVTAAFFSIEVISVGIMHYSAIVPCVISSLTAYEAAHFCGVIPTSFSISMVPELKPDMIFRVIPFAAACAVIARLFCFCMQSAARLFRKYFRNEYIRVCAGSVIIIVMTLIAGSQTFNGTGNEIIAKSFFHRSEFYLFIVKILFTAITLGCGFKGGEIIPAFFVGSTFGSFLGPLFGIDYSFGAGTGLIALFCAVTNCPITSIIMSTELFGLQSIPLFALVCGISYLISGDTGLYADQKIMYSRTKPVYVNKVLKKRS
ncbi:MAG: chloride channel protein [Oscillospiraceae bacterium]|nr:chloride channel protein [Oscillospiraceae bacterium]